MKAAQRIAVHAVACWADHVSDWPTLRAICRGEAALASTAQPLPSSTLLGAAERRRAPESVRIALHVAQQVVQACGLDASRTASVFASPHGDLGITHAMCEALADEAPALSPTHFVQSVHNVVSGHWGMATECASPSTAIANGRCTFAAAWLEAATQVACTGEPVLLVAYETEPRGATVQLTGTVGRLAVAMVLGPCSRAEVDGVTTAAGVSDRATEAFGGKGESPAAIVTWRLHDDGKPPPTTSLLPVLGHLAGNHLADALVWLQALAQADAATSPVLALPVSAAPGAVRVVWEGFEGFDG